MTTTPKKAAARPSTARKVTRKTEEKAHDALGQGVRLTLDGETYEVFLGDITPAIAAELRRQMGYSFQRLILHLNDDPDIDVLAAFAWCARRVRGEEIPFSAVTVTYEQMYADGFDLDLVDERDADTEDDGPEA